MTTYYAIINNVKVGPHTPGELMQLGMVRDTLVWRQGMTEWMPAWRLPELDSCFYIVAPGNAGQPQQRQEPCPSSHLAWAIIVTLLCCMPTGAVAIYYSSNVGNCYLYGDIEGAKRSSRNSLIWIWVSVGIGLLYLLFTFCTTVLNMLLNYS